MTNGTAQESDKSGCTAPNIILCLVAVFLPPLAVALHGCCGDGGFTCGMHMILSIVLTICFWIPGILHAWWYICKNN